MKTFMLLTLSLVFMTGCSTIFPVSGDIAKKECAVAAEKATEAPIQAFKALYAAKAIKLDGSLNEPIWKKAESYSLGLGKDRAADGTTLEQAGSVQFAWDQKNLYVAITYEDSDIIALGKEDELHHYSMGDVAELFLKPADSPNYWEMYVTPRGNKSTLFFPGKGRFSLPNAIDYSSDLKVAAKVNGTIDKWEDTDKGWTAEMVIPAKDLTAYGASFGPGSDWRVLVARYNYAKDLNLIGPELSMVPALPNTFFHLTDSYGKLEFVK